MTESDISRIQRELGITLPASYVACMSNFPLLPLRGNSDQSIWDDAAELIELNAEYRAGRHGTSPWPDYLFAIGRIEGDPCLYAIDLRSVVDAPVWWVDHGYVDGKGSGEVAASFAAWVEDLIQDLRSDLELG